jgi:hypothetical protein
MSLYHHATLTAEEAKASGNMLKYFHNCRSEKPPRLYQDSQHSILSFWSVHTTTYPRGLIFSQMAQLSFSCFF